MRELLALMTDSYSRSFAFSGRSRRSTIMLYWLGSSLIMMALDWSFRPFLDWDEKIVIGKAIELLFVIPMVALFVRRLHDQDRSGIWALSLLPLVPANIYQSLRVNFHALDPAWPEPGYLLWPLFALGLVQLVLLFLPGTQGANRFGPDPRRADGVPAHN